MKNKFCIKTRGPDHSKQIIETLVRLGYSNPKNFSGTPSNGYYYILSNNSISFSFTIEGDEIQLEDLEGNVKIKYNYLIL